MVKCFFFVNMCKGLCTIVCSKTERMEGRREGGGRKGKGGEMAGVKQWKEGKM